MKAENTTRIQFDSLSVNEAYARGAAAAFLARYDPTVPQLADLKTAVSEAVTNCIVHAYPDRVGAHHHDSLRLSGAGGQNRDRRQRSRHPGYPQSDGAALHHRKPGGALRSRFCGHAELYG